MGNAEESEDSAPTHQTLLDELDVAAKIVETGVTMRVAAGPGGEAMKSDAAKNIGITANSSSFTYRFGASPLIYPPRTSIMDSRFVW